MERIRCFIAINLPGDIADEIEHIQKELEKKKVFIGKFTEKGNLHLTLKFLGEIEEDKVEDARARLREIKFNKFSASLGELGIFSKNFIRIIWICILGKRILSLQKEIDKAMEKCGFPAEKRFMSHLTIARVKKVRDKKLFLNEIGKINVKKTEFQVNEFYLMKSALKPEGAVYEVLERFGRQIN